MSSASDEFEIAFNELRTYLMGRCAKLPFLLIICDQDTRWNFGPDASMDIGNIRVSGSIPETFTPGLFRRLADEMDAGTGTRIMPKAKLS